MPEGPQRFGAGEFQPKQPKRVEPLRRLRGWINARDESRGVRRLQKDGVMVFYVPSERFADTVYTVFGDEDGELLCSCQDFRSRMLPCKHIVEVLFRYFPAIAPSVDDLIADRGKETTYYQNARRFPRVPLDLGAGPAESTRRDHAYHEMDPRVEELLVDLGALLDSRLAGPRPAFRPSLSRGHKVIYRVARNLHRKSMRRFRPIAIRLHSEGKIAFPPSRGTQVKYENSDEMLDILREAFLEVVAPFREVDDEIVIDSSGFSPFFVSCWLSSDRGISNIRANTQWFKIHVAVGRKSKAILGFVATLHEGRGTGDGAQFEPLLAALSRQGISPRFVIADNLYLTDHNFKAARRRGVHLVGPLKAKNFHRDGTPSKAVAPLAEFIEDEPDLYDELCRVRQIVEAVFSREKRHDNHVAAIGSHLERSRARDGSGNILFVSRRVEFWVRAIRYNLERTVFWENLQSTRISYRAGTLFSRRFASGGNDVA